MQGSRGLSLFFLEVRDKEGKLNGIEVQRLKEKLGTRQVPTAELLLDGAQAHRVCQGSSGQITIHEIGGSPLLSALSWQTHTR